MMFWPISWIITSGTNSQLMSRTISQFVPGIKSMKMSGKMLDAIVKIISEIISHTIF
jgi:hypothetical protein